MKRLFSIGLLVSLLCLPAGIAAAAIAPEYVSSEPEEGAKLHEAPEEVSITFSEPLDPDSTMKVEDECGNQVDDKQVEVSLNEMRVGIAKTPSGHYIVTYAAVGVGNVTGTTNGQFHFQVLHGAACDGSGGHKHGNGKHGNGKHGGGGHGKHEGNRHGEHGEHGTGGHAGHAGTTDHMDHAMGGGVGDHAQHRAHEAEQVRAAQRENRLRGIATGESPFPDLSPDSTAVLLGLLLSIGFGGLGGLLLRVQPSK